MPCHAMPMPMHINLSYMYARVYAIYCAGLISDCKSEEEGHTAIMDLSWLVSGHMTVQMAG